MTMMMPPMPSCECGRDLGVMAGGGHGAGEACWPRWVVDLGNATVEIAVESRRRVVEAFFRGLEKPEDTGRAEA